MNSKIEQRRTVIIRGRGQSELDTLLPVFASLVAKNTPNNLEDFRDLMISDLSKVFKNHSEKTIRNYLTEIIGQLFAMFYLENGLVKIASLTLKLIEDGDQPSFFKVISSRLQFPNPMSKKQIYDEQVRDGLAIRPLVLVLDLLSEALNQGVTVTFDEISFFALNRLEALRGKLSGSKIIQEILENRKEGADLPKLLGSRERQHLKESLSLLVLANMVQTDQNNYWINQRELAALDDIAEGNQRTPLFRPRGTEESHDSYQQDWKKFLTNTSNLTSSLSETKVDALYLPKAPKVTATVSKSTNEIGREGETLVIEMENKALASKFPGEGLFATDLTAKRGIGYDILSFFHDDDKLQRHPHQIEVKSTLRVTEPNLEDQSYPDSFNLTRSEEQAVEKYGETYSIFRVYIFATGYKVQVLRNPSGLRQSGHLNLVPELWSAHYSPGDLLSDKNVMRMELE